MRETQMLMIKVGKYEHLQSFKQGNIHFNPLSFFRNDGTNFRGDKLEGTYVIDTSKGFFINGIDISKVGSGFRATQTYVDSDCTLIFCAAVLDEHNSQIVSPNIVNLSDEFSDEMRKFGQYAVVFEREGFIKSIQAALNETVCNTAWGRVQYCDKDNHAAVGDFITKNKERFGDATIYFLKDEAYRNQNEWRFIFDYIAPDTHLVLQGNGSLDLKIPPFPASQIIDLDLAVKLQE
jgi:hypothetical protein